MITPTPTRSFSSNRALLIVDPQVDFCPGGSLAVPDGDRVMEPLNRMMAYAMKNGWAIIISCDWHPRETKHFAEFGGIWPVHCVQRTFGASFHPILKIPAPNAYPWVYIVSKGESPDRDDYSVFDGHCSGINMKDLLFKLGITEVYVGGLATDYCVKATVLDARENNFDVVLLEDACRAVNLKPEDGENAISEMEEADVRISCTEEVLRESAA